MVSVVGDEQKLITLQSLYLAVGNDSMAETQSSDQTFEQALDLAEVYLSEAETVLWSTASESDSLVATSRIEELTQQIWDIQNQLKDLQEDTD